MNYLIVDSKDTGEKVKTILEAGGITNVQILVGERPMYVAPSDKETKPLRVQCFGNFEIFDSNNQPLKFARKKSKELLAYMIDRCGAMVSIEQMISILWKESENLDVKKSCTRTLLADIRKAFITAGYDDVLISRRNEYGLKMSKISCDYFDFINAIRHVGGGMTNDQTKVLFNGEYMSQYVWASETLSFLSKIAKKIR